MLIKKIKETHNNNDYLSVNAFKNLKRNDKNLMQLRSFYLDLDITETKFHNEIVEKINKKYELYNGYDTVKLINEEVHNLYISKINEICFKNEIPSPSKINYTGGGYHVYWDLNSLKEDKIKFEGASYKIKNVYKNIQKILVDIFSLVGADPACIDSSRLLRPEGSYNTKRDEITQTVLIYNKKYYLKEFTTLFKYTLEEVIEYKKITEKQLNFIINNNIKINEDPKSLTKEEAKLIISNFIEGQRKATKKQIETLNKYNHEFNENITIAEASALIKSSKPKTDYIYAILTRAYNNSDIKEGNRSLFIFYMAISHRRTNLTKEESLVKLNNYNKKLKLEKTELESICNSAFRNDIKTLNIKKETIISQLNLEPKYLRKKITRSLKSKVTTAKETLTKNFHKLESISTRKLAEQLEISKSKISDLKKEIKKIIKTKKQISKKQFLEQLDELNNQVEKLLNKCPQNVIPSTTNHINTE